MQSDRRKKANKAKVAFFHYYTYKNKDALYTKIKTVKWQLVET